MVMKKRAKVAESMIHSSDMIMVHDSPKKGDKESMTNSMGFTKGSGEWVIEDIENSDN